MSRGASHSIKTTTSSPALEAAEEAVREIVAEAETLAGVRDADIWFADARWLRFHDGAVAASRDDDHPAARAVATASTIIDCDADHPAVVAPVAVGATTMGALVARVASDGDPETVAFELAALAGRAGERLDSLRARWTADRQHLSLEFAEGATARFLDETSLHRAIRLGLTELSELAGARETQFWRLDEGQEPVCMAQPAGGNPSAERDRAIRRLVSVVGETPGPVRVVDTAASPHYGWLLDEGIKRFVALPVRAHDRHFGLVVIVDFTSAPALGSPALVPGLEAAAAAFSSATAAALFHSDTLSESGELRDRLKETHRRMEAGERDSARYELCRLAATELRRTLATVSSDLPQIEEPMPESMFRDQLHQLGDRLESAETLLSELVALTERPAARLTLTSINSVIHQVVAELEEDSDTPPLRVSRRLQGDLPELLLDETQVAEVLTALLLHGVSGTDEREAVIVTRVQKGDVIVEVSFPERVVLGGVLESLFQPFQGLDEGSGTPLSLADQVVGEHGGQLRARTEPGEGLVYWLSLPVAENRDRRNRRADRRGQRDRREHGIDEEP